MKLIRHSALDDAEKDLHRAILAADPDGIVLLIGMPGAGKTVARKLVMRAIAGDPRMWGKGRLPLMSVRAAPTDQSVFSPKDFMARSLKEVRAPQLDWLKEHMYDESLDEFESQVAEGRRLWESLGKEGSENSMRRQVEKIARERCVKHFFIDQAGSITYVHRQTEPSAHLYSLMCFAEEVPTMLVLSGTPRMHRLWDGNHEILRRSTKVFFRRYLPTSKADMLDFSRLCLSLAKDLKFHPNAHPLKTRRLAYLATLGTFGALKNFYANAERNRSNADSPAITIKHLEQAVMTQSELDALYKDAETFDSLNIPAKIELWRSSKASKKTRNEATA